MGFEFILTGILHHNQQVIMLKKEKMGEGSGLHQKRNNKDGGGELLWKH